MPGNQHYYFSKDQPITRVISNVKVKKKNQETWILCTLENTSHIYILGVFVCACVCQRENCFRIFFEKKPN